MKQTYLRRGTRRLTAFGASAALAASALAVGFAAPASAETFTVTTTVTDTAGNAIDGTVTAYVDYGSGYTEFGTSRFASGVAGMGLPTGNYKFKFSASGYATEYFTDKPDLATADVVSVATPTALPAVQLAPAAAMTGYVTDDQGRVLPYVGVSVEGASPENDDFYDYTTTGKDGVFTLAASPGQYKVYVEGTSVGNRSYRGEYWNDKYDSRSADVITHGATPTNLGAIALARGGYITGVVSAPGGVPLRDVQVTATLLPCDSSTSSCLTYDARSDASGVYAVEGLVPGSYRVDFRDLAGEYQSEYHVDTQDPAAATAVPVNKDQRVDLNAELAPVTPIDPATVDLSGRVVDQAGAPVVGATVTAHSTPADRSKVTEISSTRTNRQGYYAFTRLDAASAYVTDDAVKLQARPLSALKGEFSRQSRWQNGARNYDAAPAVAIGTTGADIVLPVTGGISGAITSEVGEPILATSAYFYTEDGDAAYSERADYDGSYTDLNLPAGKYKVQFVDRGFSNVTPYGWIGHVSEWFSDAVSFEDAKLVEVKPGQITQGINGALGATLKAVEAPEIKGQQYVGKTLTATPGTWNVKHDLTYSYEWLVGTQVVATGEKVTVSKGWTGKRLTLRVTASNERLKGTALVNTQQLGKKPKVKIKTGAAATITVKVKGVKAKKIKGKVLVREIAKVKPNGKIKYKKIGKAKIKNGKARVSLAKVKGKGKHKVVFTLTFKGKKIGGAEITKKVKRKG